MKESALQRRIAWHLIRYGFATTSQLRDWCRPGDRDGRTTRSALSKMRAAGLARRMKAEVHDPLVTSSVPVWVITEKGIAVLAALTGDPALLDRSPPATDSWQNFAHYCCVAGLLRTVDLAFAGQEEATLGCLYREHDVVNPQERDPARRFRTYTAMRLLRQGQGSAGKSSDVVCVPDACFEVALGPFRRAYYLELERGTDSPRRVAAKKSPGYLALAQTRRFLDHFPQAQDFRVLCVAAPGPSWRDALRASFDGREGAELWLFASLADLTPQTLLTGEVLFTAKDGPRPFLRRAGGAPGGAPAADRGAAPASEPAHSA